MEHYTEKKMLNLSKARLTSFKEREYEKYDENISKLASEATNVPTIIFSATI